MNGKRLAIARTRQGLSRPELAKKLGVTSRTIGGWESEKPPAPAERIPDLVRVLGFPEPFFFLDDPADVSAGAVSFRSLSRKTAAQRDAALSMCDLAVELSAWIDPRFGRDQTAVPDLMGEDAALAGEIARRDFGLGSGAVGNLVHLLEARGVRLFSLSANCREIDACSFWRDDVPYILVDMTRSSERIRFNLAHELGHLVLHRHGAPVGQEAEKQANTFASSFLMPYESLRHHLPRHVTIDTILRAKSIWGVSAMALAYRLHRTGTLSEWRYKSFIIEMRRRNYHVKEPNPIAHEESFVLGVVLDTLKKRQISLRRLAEETHLPHAEVVGLMDGLASTAIAYLDTASAEERRSSFRVV